MLVNKANFYMKLSVLEWRSADKDWRLKRKMECMLSVHSVINMVYSVLCTRHCHLRNVSEWHISVDLCGGQYLFSSDVLHLLPCEKRLFLACCKHLWSCAHGLSVLYSVCLHYLLRHKQTHYVADNSSIDFVNAKSHANKNLCFQGSICWYCKKCWSACKESKVW